MELEKLVERWNRGNILNDSKFRPNSKQAQNQASKPIKRRR
jgi:hypothetical protein